MSEQACQEEQERDLEALSSYCSDTDCLTLYERPTVVDASTCSNNFQRSISQTGSQFLPTGLVVLSPELKTTLILLGRPEGEECNIQYFPPFFFTFHLPPRYPSEEKLMFTLSTHWLSKRLLHHVTTRIQNMIDEAAGSTVLINIVYYLQHEALEELLQTFMNTSDFSRIALDALHAMDPHGMPSPERLMEVLRYHNEERLLFHFQQDLHECMVCSTLRKGVECLMFSPCNHIFCKECVKSQYSLNVKEGNVLEFHCLACDSFATPAQLSRVLTKEQQERVETLSVSRALDTMQDVAQCPRCDTRIIVDLEARLGNCTECYMAFCTLCRKSFHGKNPCAWDMKPADLLVYQKSTGEQRQHFEMKYGRERLQNALDTHLSEQYLKENNVSCPNCRTSIEKTGGCNKMSCLKCGTYFCWICSATLPRDNPYKHFSNMLSPCYNRLFQGVVPDDDLFGEGEDEFLRN